MLRPPGRHRFIAVLVATTLPVACSGSDAAPSTTTGAGTTEPPADATAEQEPSDPASTGDETTATVPPEPDDRPRADASLVEEIEAAIAAGPEGCDPLDTAHCYLPYPSDWFTQTDPDSPSGRRVTLAYAGAPVNADGVAIDVTEWNRNDGFSQNTRIQTHVEGLDAEASNLPPWTDLARSLDDDATVVLLDMSTGERVPLWAEPDPRPADDADRTLVVYPAVSLAPATTFAVALRGLVGVDGAPIEPAAVFRSYRDGLVTDIQQVEDRRFAMEEMFAALGQAGVGRDDLQLAWTFSTASTESTTGRMLHIRDATLAELGGSAPSYAVTSVVDDPPDLEGVARQVIGTFTVTNWLTADGSPGNGFHYGDADPAFELDAVPVANGTVEAPFVCNIPRAVLDGDAPGRIVQYGHGLLGQATEIDASNVRAMSNEHMVVHCATKWAGMSDDDIPNAIASLENLSNFPTLVDRLQQGVLNQVVLGRLMLADDGLVADPSFRRGDGTALIANDRLVYDGNSQGGIMGLMLTAVSPDIERAVLGVMGMNYGLLLPRSSAFELYEQILIPAYPDDLDRSLIISLLQMLWDRGEGAGYARHTVADPLPGTSAKDVLLHVAFGDWQVSELSAFVAARTMRIPVHRPVTAPDRSREVEPGWGLDTLAYPSAGSGIVVWDSGSDPIPFEQLPPTTGRDPHEDPRADADARAQKAAFLFDGKLDDVCGVGEPCFADPVNGGL